MLLPLQSRPKLQSRLLAAVFLMFLTGDLVFGAPATGRQKLQGHVPTATRLQQPVDRPAGNQTLRLSVGLPLRNKPALTNLLEQLYDPASPNYRKFLGPEEFTRLFGPTEGDYQAVIEFLGTQGLAVTGTHPNRTLIDVQGSIVQVEKTFHLTLQHYRHPRENRNFLAPDVEPSVDLEVALLAIGGLDNFIIPHPANLHPMPASVAAEATPLTGAGPGGSYLGNDFRAAYAPGTSLTGAGQIVGLLQFDGYYPADIAQYKALAGLPNVTVTNVLVDGYNGAAGVNNAEVALDIEMAISVAPGLAAVIVYEEPNPGTPNNILNRMATDNLAKQLSASWTYPVNANSDQIYQQYAAQGQSFFNASGDSGAYTGTPSQPTDNPYLTSVGGTTLTTSGPGGAWVSEKAWNWYNNGTGTSGTGGGISTSFNLPTWQQGINMTANQGSTTKRNLPDVALTGDNAWVIYNNGSSTSFGGTSVASPLWAGFTALINEQAALGGNPPIGFLNPAVYNIGKGPGYTAAFHDTVTGNNTNTTSPTKFFAVTGYDLCTGWGTPAGTNLINALAPLVAAPLIASAGFTLTAETCIPTNGVIDPGEMVTVGFALRNFGTIGTTNLVATLQTGGGVIGPGASQTFGLVPPGGSIITRSFAFTADGLCGGTVTATLQLQDGPTDLGTVNFNLPLGKMVNSTNLVQKFDGVTAPALPVGWTSSASGGQANWVTTPTRFDTSPNSAQATESTSPGLSELTSPTFAVVSSAAQLTFRNRYRTESLYDGGVLEIQIGSGAFTDILAAGGSFVAGGYSGTLSSIDDNPLAGRSAWTGSSGGSSSTFIISTVNLPSAAAGQNVRLKWRFGTDTENQGQSFTGWFIDSIVVLDSYPSCCTGSSDLAVTQIPLSSAIVGQNLTYGLSVTNLGPSSAAGVTVTDALPAGTTFVSATSGGTFLAGLVLFNLGVLPAGSSSNLTITVNPTASGLITNRVSVATTTSDPNQGNNTATNVTSVNAAALITQSPANQRVVEGKHVNFQVAATGTPPPVYQWYFNGTNLLAGATSSTLILSNVVAAQAGNYTVTVTNVAGSTTSAPAHLTVLVMPGLTGISFQGGDSTIALSFLSVTGLNYTLEYKNSLDDPDWTSLSPTTPGTGGALTLQDPTVGGPSRFYRVRCE